MLRRLLSLLKCAASSYDLIGAICCFSFLQVSSSERVNILLSVLQSI